MAIRTQPGGQAKGQPVRSARGMERLHRSLRGVLSKGRPLRSPAVGGQHARRTPALPRFGRRLGWSSLIEGAPYGVFRSMAGRRGFLEVNPALVRMLGYASKAELLAADLARDIYLDPAARSAAIDSVLAGPEASFQTEVEWRRKNGTPLHVVLHGRRLRQAGAAGALFEVMAEDVTARRRAERETAAARKLQSDFVSFVSHQLRTPLTGIRWMLELAQQAPDLPAETASCLADARQSAERLVALIADLLNVAHCEAGKTRWTPAAVDMAALTASLIRELRPQIEQKEHRLRFQPAGNLPRVMADENLLRQVMLNLLSNAIKYTPVGGDIEVRIQARGHEAVWSVRDNGIGVPQEAQARLFEKFYRAENAFELETEGTGLGLYWVRRILQQAGGRVWWESAAASAGPMQAHGSVFSFALPLPEASPGAMA